MESFLAAVLDGGVVAAGTVAADIAQQRRLWRLRESVPEASRAGGYCYKYDLSLPLACLYDIVEVMRERLRGAYLSCVGYGHVGDGNIHLNITTPTHDPAVTARIEPFVYEWTGTRCGLTAALLAVRRTHRGRVQHNTVAVSAPSTAWASRRLGIFT